MDDFYESTDDGMEEIEDAFEKYSGKGFFVIDMKFVKNEFINDVKLTLHFLNLFTWNGLVRKILSSLIRN